MINYEHINFFYIILALVLKPLKLIYGTKKKCYSYFAQNQQKKIFAQNIKKR